jgi:hypothetical protein
MKYDIPNTPKDVLIMLQRIYWGIFLGVVISPVIFYA